MTCSMRVLPIAIFMVGVLPLPTKSSIFATISDNGVHKYGKLLVRLLLLILLVRGLVV